ncbi:hypothetical protein [Microbacterium sp. SLBN-111]|uniref:hypothetical protein n=1 Tax=Microbacterium sp. SLBN-111 TaxID=3377733 RepID=UPI003C73D95D
MTDLSRASAPDDGIARRTILAGAAWSIPVIATAATAPAAAASAALTLTFDKATYAGTACSTITGAYVTATSGGVPAVGVPITISLSDGYVFTTTGSNSQTGSTSGNGRFPLQAISIPGQGGSATVIASSTAASATAILDAPQSGKAWNYIVGQTAVQIDAPDGAKVIGYNARVSADGELWVQGLRRQTGVNPDNAVAELTPTNEAAISWTDFSGKAWNYIVGQTAVQIDAPDGAKVIGYNARVSADGELWVQGSRRQTGVNPNNAISQITPDNAAAVSWTDFSGKAWNYIVGQTAVQIDAPDGAKVIGYNARVSADGELWVQGSRRQTGVNPNNAISQITPDNAAAVSWTDFSGKAWNYIVGQTAVQIDAPDGAKVIGYNARVSSDGELWVQGSRRQTGVNPNNAISQITPDNAAAVSWTDLPRC